MAKYLLDIKIGNVTTDPMVIWGQFAQNVTDTFTSLADGDFLQDGLFLQD